MLADAHQNAPGEIKKGLKLNVYKNFKYTTIKRFFISNDLDQLTDGWMCGICFRQMVLGKVPQSSDPLGNCVIRDYYTTSHDSFLNFRSAGLVRVPEKYPSISQGLALKVSVPTLDGL